MPRAMLRIDGITPDVMARLQARSKALYGTPNASQLVRELIAKELTKDTILLSSDPIPDNEITRIEIRLPKHLALTVDNLAELRFCTRQHLITAAILELVGKPQLMPDQIEVLRLSNYELSKIGSNINQIAKAFNTMVKSDHLSKLPEVAKKLASLRNEITKHISRVVNVLEESTAIKRKQRKKSVDK